tara:strand:+ start:1396 stop:3039 length:1644 start_codon:yes stop_codon:yes gene_type:complete
MFRQSIDPRGAFPPKSSKTPAKKKNEKKKPKIKRRKRTRDRFGAERKQEEVFRFGERRSGLSGRTLNKPEGERQPRQPAPRRNDNRDNYNPGDFIRVHNQAIKNQIRDEAESKRTAGGTFTGTSIGEERRVAEAKEADILFKKQEASDRSRFIGAVEKLVDKIPKATAERKSKGDFDKLLGATETKPILLPDATTAKPPPIPKKSKSITSKFFDLDEPTAETGSGATQQGLVELKDSGTQTRRPPEDDITFLSANRTRRSPTPFGTTPPQSRPRPSPSNPSSTRTIPTQSQAEGRAEIEKLRNLVLSPIKQEPEPEPEPEQRPTPEQKRRKDFLEDQTDTTEFLTPTGKIGGDTISLDKPTETPIQAPPLSSGIPQPKDDTDIVKLAKGIRADITKAKKEGEQKAIPTPEDRPAEAIKTDARLEAYKELSNFSEKQKGFPKNFDNQSQHYRLQALEDIPPEELGRQKTNKPFKKGEQFRLQRTDFKDQAIANRGFYFYKDATGKQLPPKQANLFKINLANPKVDKKFKEAIANGKIKIVFDEFDDEI